MDPVQLPFIHELALFLACAGIVVPLFRRLRVSPVLGFLAIGIVIGPLGLGRVVPPDSIWDALVIRDVETTRVVAEFGVVFLLFLIGIELSPERLWAMRRLVFGLGGSQVVVSSAALALVAAALGARPGGAVALGACLALSSTAIVMQLLAERGQIGSQVGRASFAVLLLQDLAVVPILFIIALLAADGAAVATGTAGVAILKATAAVAAIAIAGRFALRPLFRLVSGRHSADQFLAMALLVVVATALATHAAGLSLALGAFLAGLLLAETEFRHSISISIEPFKGLLLGLFFMSVGMTIDLAAVAPRAGQLLALVAAMVALKALLAFALARGFGIAAGPASEIACLLGPPGEFGFVVIGTAMAKGLLAPSIGQTSLAVVSLGMLLAPGAAWLGRVAHRRLGSGADAEPREEIPALEGHLIVAGFGRVGGMLREILDTQQLPYIAVERDAAIVAVARADGVEAYVGDAARPEMLDRLGLDRAVAIVVTMDDMPAIERIVASVRRRWPSLPIVARARDQAHARRLLALGATTVVPETLEAALELAEVSLCAAGVEHDAARQLIDRRRTEILDVLARTNSRRADAAREGVEIPP
ncbi:MAG: cation:proton antiporter [Alphaproteobacteria bacterium]|nr:cation:proton antiporter [Alphaproteobacteria bacterium]